MFARPLRAAIAGAFLAVAPGIPGATTLTFTQGGWDGGGSLRLVLQVADTNGDGEIFFESSPGDDEVFGFGLSFTGNAALPAFAVGWGDLLDLIVVYTLDGGPLGDDSGFGDEGVSAIFVGATFGGLLFAGPGPFGTVCGGTNPCSVLGVSDAFSGVVGLNFTSEALLLAAVPAPAGLGLFGLALAALALGRTRRA